MLTSHLPEKILSDAPPAASRRTRARRLGSALAAARRLSDRTLSLRDFLPERPWPFLNSADLPKPTE